MKGEGRAQQSPKGHNFCAAGYLKSGRDNEIWTTHRERVDLISTVNPETGDETPASGRFDHLPLMCLLCLVTLPQHPGSQSTALHDRTLQREHRRRCCETVH